MTQLFTPIEIPPAFPDHTQLPESDGTFVKNFQEHPQSLLLTDSIGATLDRIHPDGQYCIGQDVGIYWRETKPPEKALRLRIGFMSVGCRHSWMGDIVDRMCCGASSLHRQLY